MTSERDNLAASWARLGVLFNTAASKRTPDLEALLRATARRAPDEISVFEAAVSWLAQYGDYVAKHRLARLVAETLEPEHRPTMGLMLDLAREHGARNAERFNTALAACEKPVSAFPLLRIQRENVTFSRLAEQSASALSRKWGRWLDPFEIRLKILRPESWIARHNPSLALRALVGGDLVASILAEHEAAEAGKPGFASEMELARRCGVTRMAIRHALDRLEMAGMATRRREGRSTRIEIHPR